VQEGEEEQKLTPCKCLWLAALAALALLADDWVERLRIRKKRERGDGERGEGEG
jgi:hypothetical protein